MKIKKPARENFVSGAKYLGTSAALAGVTGAIANNAIRMTNKSKLITLIGLTAAGGITTILAGDKITRGVNAQVGKNSRAAAFAGYGTAFAADAIGSRIGLGFGIQAMEGLRKVHSGVLGARAAKAAAERSAGIVKGVVQSKEGKIIFRKVRGRIIPIGRKAIK